jgi:hypothetical protein
LVKPFHAGSLSKKASSFAAIVKVVESVTVPPAQKAVNFNVNVPANGM